MKIYEAFKHPERGDSFIFETNKKIVVLLGRNASGKTTMMRSFKMELENREDDRYIVINDNLQDIDVTKGYNGMFDPNHLIQRWSSEGERIGYAFGNIIEKIGYHVKQKDKVVCLFDRLDSGLSYNRIKEIADFCKETLVEDVELIVVSANSYELAVQFKDEADFYWVHDNKFIDLPSTFEEFIKMYEVEEENNE